MAIVRVTEYGDFRGTLPYGAPLRTQVHTTSGASAAITLGANTEYVRVHTDGIIAFNVNADAVALDARMAANTTEYFVLETGQTFNVITAT